MCEMCFHDTIKTEQKKRTFWGPKKYRTHERGPSACPTSGKNCQYFRTLYILSYDVCCYFTLYVNENLVLGHKRQSQNILPESRNLDDIWVAIYVQKSRIVKKSKVCKKMRFQNLFLASRDLDISKIQCFQKHKMETHFSTLYNRDHISSHIHCIRCIKW